MHTTLTKTAGVMSNWVKALSVTSPMTKRWSRLYFPPLVPIYLPSRVVASPRLTTTGSWPISSSWRISDMLQPLPKSKSVPITERLWVWPPIHQWQINSALCEHIGKFCHIYIDDIVIWSDSVDEHWQHIDMIMKVLKNVKLFCNKKKCKFFLL